MKAELIFEKKLNSITELPTFVQEIKEIISTQGFLLLSGELGSGKTTFTSFFCQQYKLENVQSPTYSIHHLYENQDIKIHHFDLFRLTSDDELTSTGFWDLIQDKESLKIIEWHEKINSNSWLESFCNDQNVFGLKIFINDQFKARDFQLFKIS